MNQHKGSGAAPGHGVLAQFHLWLFTPPHKDRKKAGGYYQTGNPTAIPLAPKYCLRKSSKVYSLMQQGPL